MGEIERAHEHRVDLLLGTRRVGMVVHAMSMIKESKRNTCGRQRMRSIIEVGIDKIIAQSNLSTFHCQSLRFLRFRNLFGKDGRRSCSNLQEAKFNGIRIIAKI